MKRILITAVLATLTLGAPVWSQDYLFSVPEMLLDVTVNPDSSIGMEYTIQFTCSPAGHAIEYVDVGLPDRDYDIGNMSAWVIAADGQRYECSGIGKSPEVSIGVEVPMGAGTIQPGRSGTFHFTCTMPDRVYQDTTNKDLASLRITPTWFGSQYVEGTTELGIAIYLPKDIKPEEVLHQGTAFTGKATSDTHTIVTWLMPGVTIDQEHMVGVSFPKRGMSKVVKQSKLDILLKWWNDNPGTRMFIGVILFVLFGIMWFRASQGTGVSCFLMLLGLFGFLWVTSPVLELLAIPLLPLVWYFSEKALKRKRGKYLPAIASVEGGGVKRGLTAPEAAVILEMPLNKVLVLALFGLLKKGIAEQVSADPLTLRLKPEYDVEKRGARRKVAADNGTVIHGYEQGFIEALMKAGAAPVADIKFGPAIKEMIERTVKRMKGFDLERTRSYYQYVVTRAWTDAEALGEIEQRTEKTDGDLLWLMLAPDYNDRFDTWHHRGYHYHPPWGRTTVMPSGGGGGMPAPSGQAGRTSFGDVAASFSGWTENVTSGLASSMDPLSVGLSKEGVFNLAGADKVTMDVLKSMAESSGSGGGGGGCACAGCACACACAGGGR